MRSYTGSQPTDPTERPARAFAAGLAKRSEPPAKALSAVSGSAISLPGRGLRNNFVTCGTRPQMPVPKPFARIPEPPERAHEHTPEHRHPRPGATREAQRARRERERGQAGDE